MATELQGLTIRRWISREVHDNTDGIRIRVEVIDACGCPTKIFRYLARPLNPTTGTIVGNFNGVCSPTDVAEMPEDAPAPNAEPPWYRLDYVDLLLRSYHEVNDLWDRLFEELVAFKDTLDIMNDLEGLDQDFIIGDDCSPVSSSSVSSSLPSEQSQSSSSESSQSSQSSASSESSSSGAP